MAGQAVFERTNITGDELFASLQINMPEILVVPEMLVDAETRLRAARFIGSVVMGQPGLVEVCSVEKPIESLFDALQLANEGDTNAISMVKTNVRTDVIERTIKTGHVMSKVPLLINEEGKVTQYGQSMDSIQANSLRYASENEVIRERTEAETRNAFRIEQLNREGFFEEYSFVVISRAADNMSADEMTDAGFFTDTMSCAIQVTSKHGDGLATEPAFVSGIKQRGEVRHDGETVVKLGAELGVDLSGKSAAEIIDTPLLIHNSLIPNGVIDIVKLYDDCAGGTFFGEQKPRQDYPAYLNICKSREQTFTPKIEAITSELIGEAPVIHSPLQAVERLHKLSGKHMVEYAVVHRTVDPRVFGHEAAASIERARTFAENGDYQAAAIETQKAQVSEKSSSCPTSRGSDKSSESGDNSDGTSESSGSKWMNCPFCKAKVFGDPCATRLKCGDCKAQVVNGKVTSTGDGGTKARAERSQAEAAKLKRAESKPLEV